MFGYGGYGGVGGVGGGEGAIGEAGGTEAPAPPDFGASEFDDDDGFGGTVDPTVDRCLISFPKTERARDRARCNFEAG